MIYDEDYYEHGLETGKSNYQNYRWIPELTIPMAMSIIDYLNIKPNESVLDYGCAKGYLVKALRMLRRDAWGYDTSDYALSKADEDTRAYLIKQDHLFLTPFKFGICKDVLEHIAEKELTRLLSLLKVDTLFTVVPLGCGSKYNAPTNNLDISHIHCEPEEWWLHLFKNCGWVCHWYSFRVIGIKDSYADVHPKSHLFMVHTR